MAKEKNHPNDLHATELPPRRFRVKMEWYMFFRSTPTYWGKGPSGKGV